MTTGSQVISDNAKGAAPVGFGGQLLGALAGGVRGLIDIELQERAGRVPDQADARDRSPSIDPSQPQASALEDIARNLTPVQIGGLLVAGGLAVALATGQFR